MHLFDQILFFGGKVNHSTEISMRDSVTASIYAEHLELLYCPLDKASTYSTLIIPHGRSPSPAIKPPDQPTASRIVIDGWREGKAWVAIQLEKNPAENPAENQAQNLCKVCKEKYNKKNHKF